MAKTTMIKVGVWEVPGVGKNYRYRVIKAGKNRAWDIYRFPRNAAPDDSPWEFVETGFRSKASAVEYVVEQAAKDDVKNPVDDLLNNIDDGIDLNNEGWDT